MMLSPPSAKKLSSRSTSVMSSSSSSRAIRACSVSAEPRGDRSRRLGVALGVGGGEQLSMTAGGQQLHAGHARIRCCGERVERGVERVGDVPHGLRFVEIGVGDDPHVQSPVGCHVQATFRSSSDASKSSGSGTTVVSPLR